MLSLEEFFLLDGLENKEKEKIIEGFNPPVAFSKGEVIYTADKFSSSLGIVCSGTAFAVTNNGQGVFMNSFPCGGVFGAAAIFGGGEKYVSTVIAKTDVQILFITEEALNSIFLFYPKTAINYISFLSDKVRFLNKKLSVLSCSNAEDTVLNYLTSVTNSDGYALIPKNMTMLARMLGIGRATLYRCLDSLQANGIILRENNTVKVIKNEKNY